VRCSIVFGRCSSKFYFKLARPVRMVTMFGDDIRGPQLDSILKAL